MSKMSEDEATPPVAPTDAQGDVEVISNDEHQPEFPVDKVKLMYKERHKVDWKVPLDPSGLLEDILLACTELAKTGRYMEYPDFYKFCDGELVFTFRRAFFISDMEKWSPEEIHPLYIHTLLGVQFCTAMVDTDYPPVLELLAYLLDPDVCFHKRSDYDLWGMDKIRTAPYESKNLEKFTAIFQALPEIGHYYCPYLEQKTLPTFATGVLGDSRPLLQDLMNLFGRLGGMDAILGRFQDFLSRPLTYRLIFSYLTIFERCSKYWSVYAIRTYIQPIIECALNCLRGMSENDMRETLRKEQNKPHLADFHILQSLYRLCHYYSFNYSNLDEVYLSLIQKTLKVDIFTAKMSALSALKDAIDDYKLASLGVEVREQTLIRWLKHNQVVPLLLRENLHQSQYVEKLTAVVAFLVKCHELSPNELEEIWDAQMGKHEAIVKNVETMLANLVHDLEPKQLDHLFDCMQASFKTAETGEQERLIKLICRLAVKNLSDMQSKTLDFLWSIAVQCSIDEELGAIALKAHHSLLIESPDALQLWLFKFADILKEDSDDNTVLRAAQQFMMTRLNLEQFSALEQLVVQYDLISVCIKCIESYIKKYLAKCTRPNHDTCIDSLSSQPPSTTSTLSRCEMVATTTSTSSNPEAPAIQASKVLEDPRSGCSGTKTPTALRASVLSPKAHLVHIKSRVDLLKSLAKRSKVFPNLENMNQLWQYLVVDTEVLTAEPETCSAASSAESEASVVCSVAQEIRDYCFLWFHPTQNALVKPYIEEFFVDNILKLKPESMNLAGMRLFTLFFNEVYAALPIDSELHDLKGRDHMWNIALNGSDKVAQMAISTLCNTYAASLSARIDPVKLRVDFVNKCYGFLSESCSKVYELLKTRSGDSGTTRLSREKLRQMLPSVMREAEACLNVLDRVMHALRLFFDHCVGPFPTVREHLPLRLAWSGSTVCLTVMYTLERSRSFEGVVRAHDLPVSGIGKVDTLTVLTHTNESVARLRDRILLMWMNQQAGIEDANTEPDIAKSDLLKKLEVQFDEFDRLTNTMSIATLLLMIAENSRIPGISSDSTASQDPDLETPMVSVSIHLATPRDTGSSLVEHQILPGLGLPRPEPLYPSSFSSLDHYSSVSSNKGIPRASPVVSDDDLENEHPTSPGLFPAGPGPVVRGPLPKTVSTATKSDDASINSRSPPSATSSQFGEPASPPELPRMNPLGDSEDFDMYMKSASNLNFAEADNQRMQSILWDIECVRKVGDESNLPDCIISEKKSFLQLLFNICDLAVSLDLNDLRDKTLDVLFALPLNEFYKNSLHRLLIDRDNVARLGGLLQSPGAELELTCDLEKDLNCLECCHSPVQQLYLLHTLYVFLNPSFKTFYWNPSLTEASEAMEDMNYSGMLLFLRNGGLKALLSTHVFADPQKVAESPLTQLILLWVCRILSLCLQCCVNTVISLYEQDTSPDWLKKMMDLLLVLDTSNPHELNSKTHKIYAENFALFACEQKVHFDEIRLGWLEVPQDSCERLREVIRHVCLLQSHSAESVYQAQHDSGCVSPIPDDAIPVEPFNWSNNMAFTFSRTCGLGPLPLNLYFRTGFLVETAFVALPHSQSLRGVLPNVQTLPRLLSYDSGHTSGCLATTALSTLGLLLCVAPDSKIVDAMTLPDSEGVDTKLTNMKFWLGFLNESLMNSSSRLVRHETCNMVEVLVPGGITMGVGMRVSSDINEVPEYDLDVANVVISYLLQLLSEHESRVSKQPSGSVATTSDCADALIRIMNYLRSRSANSKTSFDVIFRQELTWLKEKMPIPSMQSILSGKVETPFHWQYPDLLRSHLQVVSSLVDLQKGGSLLKMVKDFTLIAVIKALIQVLLFPATRPYKEVCERRRLRPHEVVSVDAILAVCRVIKTPPMDLEEQGLNLLLRLARAAPDIFVPILTEQLLDAIYLPSAAPKVWSSGEEVSFAGAQSRRFADLSEKGMLASPGFAGLKNGGATCYMNSVLQQLFSIVPIRFAILSSPVSEALSKAGVDPSSLYELTPLSPRSTSGASSATVNKLATLFALQDMFAYLTYTRKKFHEPSVFWRHFKLGGEPINRREQHDAEEFMNCLVDTADEALKLCGGSKVMEEMMGGIFEDQKICIDCPHRYQRAEPFLMLSVELHKQGKLANSLEEFVKSDLLEGENAYLCETCNKKVAAHKRMCIKRLPPILAIHLKRFIFDWDTNETIKRNDYLEFPLELDMAPYTAEGLAKREEPTTSAERMAPGEEEDPNQASSSSLPPGAAQEQQRTRYTLRGVVVHSGTAAGGHYFSYILHKEKGRSKWYKYDDTNVTPVGFDRDFDMATAWYGSRPGARTVGPLPEYRYNSPQRHWSAYLLFYEREDFAEVMGVSSISHSLHSLSLSAKASSPIPCPSHIASQIYAQNVEYFNATILASPKLEEFMRSLLSLDLPEMPEANVEKVRACLARLMVRYCFEAPTHTWEHHWDSWYLPILSACESLECRRVFSQSRCFTSPDYIQQCLDQSPNPWIRYLYSTLLVHLASCRLSIDKDSDVADTLVASVFDAGRKGLTALSRVYSASLVQPFGWPHESQVEVNFARRASVVAYYFAILSDFLEANYPVNVERFKACNLLELLYSTLLTHEGLAAYTKRPLTACTCTVHNTNPAAEYASDFIRRLGVKEETWMPQCTGLSALHLMVEGVDSMDDGPAVGELPPADFPSAVCIAPTKPHLFHLSVGMSLRLSPVNTFTTLLINALMRQKDSRLWRNLLSETDDMKVFLENLLAKCLNQGTVTLISTLLQELGQDNLLCSKVIIAVLADAIFPNFPTPAMKLLEELEISLLVDVLGIQDDLITNRLHFAFDSTGDIKLLELTWKSDPCTPNYTGTKFLNALLTLILKNDNFQIFFLLHPDAAANLRKLVGNVLPHIGQTFQRPYLENLESVLNLYERHSELLKACSAEAEGSSPEEDDKSPEGGELLPSMDVEVSGQEAEEAEQTGPKTPPEEPEPATSDSAVDMDVEKVSESPNRVDD